MTHTIEAWDPEKHIALLRAWTAARGLHEYPVWESTLPPVGFVVDRIVCGHLRLTDTPWAMIDCYHSDPMSEKEARRSALAALTERLIAESRARGIKALVAYAEHHSVVDIGRASGFHVFEQPYTYILQVLS